MRTCNLPFRKGAFVAMAALAVACRAAVLFLTTACVAARAAEAEPHAAPLKPLCLTASETRDEVRAHKLLEPFAALKSAAQQRKAEALSARLCHAGDEFIYEITLLHRDGRLTRVQMDAGTGKLIARQPREPREPHETAVTRESHEPPATRETHDGPVTGPKN
jgi:hypothetical protein